MTVKIQKWGNSRGIRIPKVILDDLVWSDNEEVDLTVSDGKIIIERLERRERPDIHDLFAGYDGRYDPADIDWGEPSGREVW